MIKKKKKKSTPKDDRVGNCVKTLLMMPYSYSDIVKRTKKRFPQSAINTATVRWYAWKLRKNKVKLPLRPNSRFA